MPEGFTYRNPRFFKRAEEGVSEVKIVGDYPAIAKAYRVEDLSVQVTPNIPVEWEELPWQELRALASEIAGRAITTKADALETVQGALDARGV